MNGCERGYTQVKRVSFDFETIVRKIMLRRLLARRAASKTENQQQENVEDAPISNDDVDNGQNTLVKEIPEKVGIFYETKSSSIMFNTADNKLVIEEVARKDELINENTKNTDNNFKKSKIDNEESDEEKEKKDKEKESAAEEVESSSESLPESEAESNAESCHSEFRSDAEEKDSGIEKGESPNLLCQDIEGRENKTTTKENDEKPENAQQNVLISVLKKSKLPANTTLQVMSPGKAKTRRLVKRGKQAKRLTKENSGLDSCDSSPEKKQRGRKNLTVSYLSYPQRYVRSSLAVEARLSQWRKETSVVEGRGSRQVESPARTRKLKQTPQNTVRNSMCQRNNGSFKATSKNVNFTDRRHSESSDTSSDEDMKHMSVRKIYSSKKALRKKISNLEGMLLSMAIQKEGLENIIFIINTWSTELSTVERTKLGVPYIRSVKQVLKKQLQSLNSKKSEFSQLMDLLSKESVPCFENVTKMLKQLNKDISSIVRDRKRYSSRHIEDIRQIQGKIIGTCGAITSVYYEE